jgi:hypothetical protein
MIEANPFGPLIIPDQVINPFAGRRSARTRRQIERPALRTGKGRLKRRRIRSVLAIVAAAEGSGPGNSVMA